jgi:hypothetical protein
MIIAPKSTLIIQDWACFRITLSIHSLLGLRFANAYAQARRRDMHLVRQVDLPHSKRQDVGRPHPPIHGE